jgi:hypothetical protein
MNVYGYGYRLSFVSRVWIRELYIRVIPAQLPSLVEVASTGEDLIWLEGLLVELPMAGLSATSTW